MATKITPIFFANVNNGKLIFENPNKFNYYLKGLGNRKVVVTLKPPRKPRTNNENRYYWGVVLEIISNEIGITPEEAHDLMKIQFLKKRINEKLWTVRSTASLNTLDFEDYLENVRRFASLELNLIIPLPNEVEL